MLKFLSSLFDWFLDYSKALIPSFLIIGLVYSVFIAPSRSEMNIMDLGTPYSMGLSHYKEINELGLCTDYGYFIADYVSHKKSTRRKVINSGQNYKYYTTKDINSKSKSLLRNKNYGYLFSDIAVEMDKMDIVFKDPGPQHTNSFISSNTIDQGRFVLDRLSGVTYAGYDQVKIFSTIEYQRCVGLEKHASLVDKTFYYIKEKGSSLFQ